MRTLAISVLLALAGCGAHPAPADDVRSFPPDRDVGANDRISERLRRMHEPAVWATPAGLEVYRCTIAEASGRTEVFRLVVDHGRAVLVHRASPPDLDETRPVDPARVAAVRARLDAAAFWSTEPRSTDGSGAILEAFVDGRYHVAGVTSPSDPLQAACESIAAAAE